MALPSELQGDPVQFYKDLKAKVMSKTAKKDRRDSESDTSINSKSSEEISLERNGSKKGLRRKSSLGVITEKRVTGDSAEQKGDSDVVDGASSDISVNTCSSENLLDDAEDSNNNEKDGHKAEPDASVMDCSSQCNSLVPQTTHCPVSSDIHLQTANNEEEVGNNSETEMAMEVESHTIQQDTVRIEISVNGVDSVEDMEDS